MELDELLEALELESPGEFGYFEHFADLIECDNYIAYPDFYTVLSEVPSYLLEELSQNYFEDILTNLPDDIIDIYTLLTSIQKCLVGLAAYADTPDGRRAYMDELYKFRCWYAVDSTVYGTDKKTGRPFEITVCEAMAYCRMEKLNEGDFSYDFSECLDYELEEYTMKISTSSIQSDYDEESSHEDTNPYDAYSHCHEDHDHQDSEEAFTTGLVDRYNPVIDGEFSDEEDENI